MNLQLSLTPELIAQLRDAIRPTQAEVDLFASAVAEKLRTSPQVWTLREFAARMGKSYSWAYEQVRKGNLKTIRPNGNGDRLITAEAAQEWLTSMRGAE